MPLVLAGNHDSGTSLDDAGHSLDVYHESTFPTQDPTLTATFSGFHFLPY